jgi:hypothetical protein
MSDRSLYAIYIGALGVVGCLGPLLVLGFWALVLAALVKWVFF